MSQVVAISFLIFLSLIRLDGLVTLSEASGKGTMDEQKYQDSVGRTGFIANNSLCSIWKPDPSFLLS